MTARVVILAAIVLAAIGTVLAFVSLSEVDQPGVVTVLAGTLVPLGVALLLVGLVLQHRARRQTP